ncbi:MAG: response regulator [Cyanobacteria bacterium P01_D01_bin.105]
MVETHAILEFVEDLIHQETETYCSELQRRILIAALQEERKTYDQLAEECGYSSRYVKQDVAPKLWLLISQAVGEKVTKANVRAALEATMRNRASRFSGSRFSATNQAPIVDCEPTVEQAPAPAHRPMPDVQDRYTAAPLSVSDIASELDTSELAISELATDAKANILLVDDQPQNLKLLSDLLEEQGYEVQQAINGAIALQAVQASPPDLVLLDIHMPQMDGYTLCQYIKADETISSIPIIFISAIDEPWDKVKAFSAGGCDYITKPFKVVEVLARVENHLKIRQLQKTLTAQNAKLQQAIQELQRLAAIDDITQVACRRRFDVYLLDCWQRATKNRTSLTLLLVQVDDFSIYEQSQSSQFGDQALFNIAQIIQQSVQGTQDLVARYGTFTFAVLLPQQTNVDGKTIAENLLKRAQCFSPLKESRLKESRKDITQNPRPTLSIGIVSSNFSTKEPVYPGIGEFLEASEHTLQKAKQNGNCIVDA